MEDPNEDPETVGEELAACEALGALCQMGAIDTMLSNFILPLQVQAHAELAQMRDPMPKCGTRCPNAGPDA